MKTLDLKEAAAFLKMHPEEVRRRARLGQLPGAKVGKRWVFLEDDLVAYVRASCPSSRQALQVTSPKEQQTCHLSSAEIRGRSPSPRHQESALDALLKQAVRRKPKSSTTG
jgi:hypothetical protein